MKLVVVGATGTIGSAVASALEANGHEVLGVSRGSGLRADISDPTSIKELFKNTGRVDGVISCAGDAAFKPLLDLDDNDISFSLGNKLMGQVNLVRFGYQHVNDDGVFVLTSGIFSRDPVPGVPAIAMVNGAIECFARASALDLPRGIRINVVSPPFITETALRMGMPINGTLSAAENAVSYVALVEGDQSGEVVFPGD